jgi:hypothetical protein
MNCRSLSAVKLSTVMSCRGKMEMQVFIGLGGVKYPRSAHILTGAPASDQIRDLFMSTLKH